MHAARHARVVVCGYVVGVKGRYCHAVDACASCMLHVLCLTVSVVLCFAGACQRKPVVCTVVLRALASVA